MDWVERSWDFYRDGRDASIELTFHAPRVASGFSNGLNDGSRDTSGKPLVSLFSLHNLPQGIVGFDCFFGGGRFASLAVEQQVIRHHDGCEGLRDEVRTRRVECQRPVQLQSLPASSASTG
jgi:hypothetical protein